MVSEVDERDIMNTNAVVRPEHDQRRVLQDQRVAYDGTGDGEDYVCCSFVYVFRPISRGRVRY